MNFLYKGNFVVHVLQVSVPFIYQRINVSVSSNVCRNVLDSVDETNSVLLSVDPRTYKGTLDEVTLIGTSIDP